VRDSQERFVTLRRSNAAFLIVELKVLIARSQASQCRHDPF
jgi:hypothetical protein